MISKIYKELKKLNFKIPNNLIKNWSTDLNREFSTEESLMTKTLKELFNNLSYQGNANQNDSKIPSYTCQND